MKNLDKLIESLKEKLGDNLASVIAFGSQANVEDAKNNLNLMIVTNTLNAEDLYSMSNPIKKWVKAKNPIPVVMNKDEWYSSFDVYSIEYADIRENHRIVYGENLIPSIYINKHFLLQNFWLSKMVQPCSMHLYQYLPLDLFHLCIQST